MSLYYVNPNDEPRECPRSHNSFFDDAELARLRPYRHAEDCVGGCHGTGRLGNPEAPKIETYWACLNSGEQFWQWRLSTPGASFGLGWSAPEYTTEAAAVAAARAALKGGN